MKRKLIKFLLTQDMFLNAQRIFHSETRKNNTDGRQKLEGSLNSMLMTYYECGVVKHENVWVKVDRNPEDKNAVILTAMHRNLPILNEHNNSAFYLCTADDLKFDKKTNSYIPVFNV